MKKRALVIFVSIVTIACQQTTPLSDGKARSILQSALQDTTNVLSNEPFLIDDEETAVQFAEALLFEAYGQETIEKEKPYNIKNMAGYWILTGTVHTKLGGAFEIVIRAHDGKVIRQLHYK